MTYVGLMLQQQCSLCYNQPALSDPIEKAGQNKHNSPHKYWDPKRGRVVAGTIIFNDYKWFEVFVCTESAINKQMFVLTADSAS